MARRYDRGRPMKRRISALSPERAALRSGFLPHCTVIKQLNQGANMAIIRDLTPHPDMRAGTATFHSAERSP